MAMVLEGLRVLEKEGREMGIWFVFLVNKKFIIKD